MLEIVYVLTNPAMPGFVKIGRTTAEDVNLRLAQLYTTGVPFPFDLQFACSVPNSAEVEDALHKAFSPNRVNARREFFKIEPDQAIAILKLLHVEDKTAQIEAQPSQIPAEEIAASEQYKARRPPMNFREMGIPAGSVLTMKGSPGTTVTVVGDKKVDLGGETLSLTAATQSVLGNENPIQPSPLWLFEGKLLKEIYDETY